MERVTVTVPSILLSYIDALKLYYDCSTRSEIVEKALDELVRKAGQDVAFWDCVNEIINYEEVE